MSTLFAFLRWENVHAVHGACTEIICVFHSDAPIFSRGQTFSRLCEAEIRAWASGPRATLSGPSFVKRGSIRRWSTDIAAGICSWVASCCITRHHLYLRNPSTVPGWQGPKIQGHERHWPKLEFFHVFSVVPTFWCSFAMFCYVLLARLSPIWSCIQVAEISRAQSAPSLVRRGETWDRGRLQTVDSVDIECGHVLAAADVKHLTHRLAVERVWVRNSENVRKVS